MGFLSKKVVSITIFMVTLIRTSNEHPDFISLVQLLDEELAFRDGADHPFYAQFNKIETIRYAVVAFENEAPVSCGAIKDYSTGITEVKRMFTIPSARGKGTASKVLAELELWALQQGYRKCILETGIKQPEAIGLYKKNGYKLIPNYGQYAGIENSLCFEKEISSTFIY